MAQTPKVVEQPGQQAATQPQQPTRFTVGDIMQDVERLTALQEEAVAVTAQNNQRLQRATGLLSQEATSAFERMQTAYANIKRNNSNPAFYNGFMVLFGDDSYSNRNQGVALQESQMQIEQANSRFSMLQNLNKAQQEVAKAAIQNAQDRLKLKLDMRGEMRATAGEARAQAGEARAQTLFPYQLRATAAGATSAENQAVISSGNAITSQLNQMSTEQLASFAGTQEGQRVAGLVEDELDRRTKREIATDKALLSLESDKTNLQTSSISLRNAQTKQRTEAAENFVKSLTNAEIDTLTRAAENGRGVVTIPTADGEVNIPVTRQQVDQWAAEVTTAQSKRLEEVLGGEMASTQAAVAFTGATHAVTAARLFDVDLGPNSAELSLFKTGNILLDMADNTRDRLGKAAKFNQATQIFTQLDQLLTAKVTNVDKDLEPHVKHVLDTGSVTTEGATEFLMRGLPSPSGTVTPGFKDTFSILRADIAKRINPALLRVDPRTGQSLVDFAAMAQATTGSEKSRFRSYLTAALDNPEIRTQLQGDMQHDYMLAVVGQMQKLGIDVKELITVTNNVPMWRNNVYTEGSFDQAKVLRMLAAKGIDSVTEGGTVEDLFFNQFVTLYRDSQMINSFEQSVADTMDVEALSLLKMITGKDTVNGLTQAITLEERKADIFAPLIAELQKVQAQANQLAAASGVPPTKVKAMDMAIAGTSSGVLQKDIEAYVKPYIDRFFSG
jgi:hypothetical protein